MSLVIQSEQPVHFPKNRDVFKFDEEVAEIFENMAMRSIPMYEEMHKIHCALLKDRFHGNSTVVDIGASTGRWFRTMRRTLGVKSLSDIPGLRCLAIDNSQPMLDKLAVEFPEVERHFIDLAHPPKNFVRANIVVMFYVLQFIPNDLKRQALRWVHEQMPLGGVLLLGQKEAVSEEFLFPCMPEKFQDEYINFRKDNGYTQEEIDAKTLALKKAMWCITPEQLRALLFASGFRRIVETTRWLQFSTWMVIK